MRANLTPWARRRSWRAWWQLRAREVTWSTSQTTRSSRKGRIGVGPQHDLGKVATLTSGGECLEPCKRGKEHSRCNGSVRTFDAADIKSEGHDMAIVLGNEMADAMAKQAGCGCGASGLGGRAGMASPEANR